MFFLPPSSLNSSFRSSNTSKPRAIAVAVAVTVLALCATLACPASARTATAAGGASVVFSEDFEAGAPGWTYYTNGRDGAAQVVNSPTHGGIGALRGTATADPAQSEIGLAHIRDGLSFNEDNSALSFWYLAEGTATFRSLVVEVRTAAGADYFTTVPAGIATGAWTRASIALTDVSDQLAGAAITRFVVKAVTDSAAGTADFTIDDVEIANGVQPPPQASATSPVDGATNVRPNRVITAFLNTALDRTSVTDASATVSIAGQAVPAAVRYAAGQHAVMVVPLHPLPPNADVDVSITDVRSAAGVSLDQPITWGFRTAAGTNPAPPETLLRDELTSAAPWSLYSNADSSSAQIVTSPVHSGGTALQGVGTAAGPFVISHIRTAHWLDENSSIGFWFRVDGSAEPADLVVAAATDAGYTKFRVLDAGSIPTGEWRHVQLALSDIDPGLVGQFVRSVELKLETATGGEAAFTVDDVQVTQSLTPFATQVRAAAKDDDSPVGSLTPEIKTQVRELADQILTSQKPDGSLVVGPVGDPWSGKVDPYAANYATLGLLRAFEVTGKRAYREAADQWLAWYQSHMDADGIVDDCLGVYPNCVDTGDHDSVDSYAATYLLAVQKRVQVTPAGVARKQYLQAVQPFVTKAERALDTVFLTDGTTIAKQSYPVRFAMDNAETYNGEVAAVRLARDVHDAVQRRLAAYLAARNLYALRARYPVQPDGHFAVAVHPNGIQEGPLEHWFPDALASVLPLSHIGGPGDLPLFQQLVQKFDVGQADQRPLAINDTPQYMWWAQAALRVGDPAAAQHFVDEYLSIEGRRNPATLAITAGHLIRILTFDRDHSLWF
ncbi:Ig-like domain-containing protein [Kribbella kalugense]|uniref:Ig-like domain-containing protein n=1 Tax=Kribbella kalugense TaxID=2512221 RepID=A0A4R8A171_9ACTN|nr:Ig-like domain-containing protein [Kribbella kalugense]TDW24257.1 Ig-like domain-containing protein [Kribbella kalugense]